MSKVLTKMLDRLLAGLMSGPNMNCRPHHSRQRVDLTQLGKLADVSPEEVLKHLLGPEKCARSVARVKLPRKSDGEENGKSPAERAWIDQSNLLNKLRVIADDARTYENDTGVHALSIGFPILSLPPGSFAGAARGSTKRILAPIAFIPVNVLLKRGATPSIELSCRGEGADRVSANVALLSWIEQQTGKPQRAELFEDEEGVDPWREIYELTKHVAEAMALELPEVLQEQLSRSVLRETAEGAEGAQSTLPGGASDVGEALPNPTPIDDQMHPTAAPREEPAAEPQGSVPHGPQWKLQPAPRGEDDAEQPSILLSAVLGLFPTAHQGLLRDTRAMLTDATPPAGPIQNFLSSGIDFDAPVAPVTVETTTTTPVSSRAINTERLAAAADPCQARAVALAREATGLVVHGPPGTGKSQTITNIIADHLARGQRVLLVCDKRTALDVVANRLEHMGLRSLCGIVHDPQRDQRDLYRSIHQQLDELPEAKLHPRAAGALERVDVELQQLHDELTQFHNALMKPTQGGEPSFHELMGRWMASHYDSTVRLSDANIKEIHAAALQQKEAALLELFQRATTADWTRNPWTKCAGVTLADFLSQPMAAARTALQRIVSAAESADATADDRIPAFTDNLPVQQQAAARAGLASQMIEAMSQARSVGLKPLALAMIDANVPGSGMFNPDDGDLRILRSGPLDPALLAVIQPQIPQLMKDAAALPTETAKLESYLQVAETWKGLFAFGVKREAATLLKRFGMKRTPDDARQLGRFFVLLGARLRLNIVVDKAGLAGDQQIEAFYKSGQQWTEIIRQWSDPALKGIKAAFEDVFARVGFEEPLTIESDAVIEKFIEGLKLSVPRADAITRLEEQFANAGLFDPQWTADFSTSLRSGKLAQDPAAALTGHLDQPGGGTARSRRSCCVTCGIFAGGRRAVIAGDRPG